MRIHSIRAVLFFAATLGIVCAPAAAQVPGPVVNVVASDPFNQKQVEVDAAANPNNPSHILTGFIDYQTVVRNEEPLNPDDDTIISKAWCTYSFSTNAGRTWKSALAPGGIMQVGNPAKAPDGTNNSPINQALKCSDPAVAWDTSGHVFYLAIARDHPTLDTIFFVSRFTDLDDGKGTLRYDFTTVIDTGNPSSLGQNLDKPSLLFVPDANSSDPAAGTLFACGTIFDGKIGNNYRNKVVCALASLPPGGLRDDIGKTFSKANQGKINGYVNTNNGTAIAPSYDTTGKPDGGVYVFWRAFVDSENGYWFVKLGKDGNANAPTKVVWLGPSFTPYDAPTIGKCDPPATPSACYLARSHAFPTVGTDANGRILLAFQAYSDSSRSMAPPSDSNRIGPRIFLTYFANGQWSTPQTVDYFGPSALQFMPRLAVAGGGSFQILYYDSRYDGRPLANVNNGAYFLPVGGDRRFDARVVQGRIDSAGNVSFSPSSALVSQYRRNNGSSSAKILDRPLSATCLADTYTSTPFPAPFLGNCPALLFPNLPIGGGGTVPFFGDYIALAPAVPLVRNPAGSPSSWRFANGSADPQTFLAFFTSTQDVGFPLMPGSTTDHSINGDWTNFSPASFTATSCANPKTRDANIYFSAISPGLVASWSGTSNTLLDSTGTIRIPPMFTLTVQNRSGLSVSVRLTIQDGPTGGAEDWSFVQTPRGGPAPTDQDTVDTQILRHSSVSLPVYYRPPTGSPTEPVTVQVQQINGVLQTSVTYSLSGSTFSLPPNVDVDDVDVDDVDVDDVDVDDVDVDDVDVDDVDVDDVDVDDKEIGGDLIYDHTVTWGVTGNGGSRPTPGNSITNVVNGQAQLGAGYWFQLVSYLTQSNLDVNPDAPCTTVPKPTAVSFSNFHITPSQAGNVSQVGNSTGDVHALDLTSVSDPYASNATFVVGPNDHVRVRLRSFRPRGSPPSPAPTTDTVGQAIFSQVVDPIANTRASSFTDTTAPDITPIVGGSKGNDGWYRSPVTVNWSVTDPQSGITSKTGCDPWTSSGDTNGTTLRCTATNGNGLSNFSEVTIRIDTTPPTVTANIIPTSPAATGWYNVETGRPTVSFTCSDSGSGVAPGACPAPVEVGDGAVAQTISSGVVTDRAGNPAAPVSISGIKVDATPPTLTASISPPSPASTGWYNAATGQPTVSFPVCVDPAPGSGLSASTPCPGPVTLSEGANQSVSRSVSDVAGNTATATLSGINVDTKPPTITITTPANNGTYVLNASLASSYTCSDPVPGSGVAACNGPVASGSNFSTATVGSNPFTVTATDIAGNSATRTNTYFVVYNFVLTPPKSPANLGSAVPLIWQLKDANGNLFTEISTQLDIWSVFNGPAPASGCAASLTGYGANPIRVLYEFPTGATGNSSLQVNSRTKTFQFNWDTTTAVTTGVGCYTVVFKLIDNPQLVLVVSPPSFTGMYAGRTTFVQLKSK